MIYTKNYFDKDNIEDITYLNLLEYFKIERQESEKIEYKSFVSRGEDSLEKKEKGIMKTIAGFLNSEGGLLIWGAPVGQKIEGKKEKVFVGNLSLVDHFYEKDQLISKITDSITPAPRGILFHRIEHQGKYIYLLETPKSDYSPHQFADIFYMRIDGQTKPAPYHYTEALFKKIKYPNLNGYLKLEDWTLFSHGYKLNINIFIFNHSKLQNDYDLSYRLICDKGKFEGWDSLVPGSIITTEGHEKRRTNIKGVIHYGEPFCQQETIIFDMKDLQNTLEVNIALLLGAKYSPMKISTYKLQLNRQKPNNMNDWFGEIKENELLGENNDKSEEEKLKLILGR